MYVCIELYTRSHLARCPELYVATLCIASDLFDTRAEEGRDEPSNEISPFKFGAKRCMRHVPQHLPRTGAV